MSEYADRVGMKGITIKVILRSRQHGFLLFMSLAYPCSGNALYIEMLSGKTIEISQFENSSTIEEIKRLIEDKEGIPSNQQRLVFAGKQLEDDRILSGWTTSDLYLLLFSYTPPDYGIQRGSVLRLILNLRRASRPYSEDALNIETLTGKRIEIFNFEITDTVENVKNVIQSMEGIPPDQQRLIFAGIPLEDGRTFSGRLPFRSQFKRILMQC